MKVSELTGAELDYWVARAQDLPPDEVMLGKGGVHCHVCVPTEERGHDMGILLDAWTPGEFRIYKPSEWWGHGGPIIGRERITLNIYSFGGVSADVRAEYSGGEVIESEASGDGPTPLIAAMRAYVASKYGEEVPEIDQ